MLMDIEDFGYVPQRYVSVLYAWGGADKGDVIVRFHESKDGMQAHVEREAEDGSTLCALFDLVEGVQLDAQLVPKQCLTYGLDF